MDAGDAFEKRTISGEDLVELIAIIEEGKGNFIANRIIDGVLNIKKCALSLIFIETEFKREVTIDLTDDHPVSLHFQRCTFGKIRVLGNTRNDNKIFINKSTGSIFKLDKVTAKGCYINGGSITELSLTGCDFKRLDIQSVHHTKISMQKNVIEEVCMFDCGECFDIDAGYNTESANNFHKLEMFFNSRTSGKMMFDNLSLDSIGLSGHCDNVLLDLRSVTLRRFAAVYFFNHGQIVVSNPKFLDFAEVFIKRSNLGKLTLFDVDLTIPCVSLQQVNLTGIEYTDVKWCSAIANSTNSGGPVDASHAQKREIFRQLKSVASKHLDKPEELKFYSLEMQSYKNEVKGRRENREERLILSFNEFTNKNGTSAYRAFILIVLNVVIFYFLIKILLGYTRFDIRLSLLTVAEIVECFNPFRKFIDSFGLPGSVPKTMGAAAARVLDFIFLRLLLGLLLYQMARAFRRYVR